MARGSEVGWVKDGVELTRVQNDESRGGIGWMGRMEDAAIQGPLTMMLKFEVPLRSLFGMTLIAWEVRSKEAGGTTVIIKKPGFSTCT